MKKQTDKKQTLHVKEGITQPEQINKDIILSLKKEQKNFKNDPDYYINGIKNGDRTILAQALTIIESSLPKHQELARKIINACLPFSGNSYRIGISGLPGAGKSTFIEAIGQLLISLKYKIAVLAIDPSSKISGGSILGDKTRMENLSANINAFIRPSPSSGTLGGVARKTRESIILCEAAGYNIIFIETVGVGQSEIAAHSMVDFFILLTIAGGGDQLQGIKRGIMEISDMIIINKDDGPNSTIINKAKAEYISSLQFMIPLRPHWKPVVETCSAIQSKNIDNIWNHINNYFYLSKYTGYLYTNRNQQAKYWMEETINNELLNLFYNNSSIKKHINTIEKELLNNKITPFDAAQELLNIFFKNILNQNNP